jgi:DNA-directed RNA polymerase specialized sigma subunit
MVQIELKYVRRDNTNIRKYSDSLWRALRKERFKKADPDKFVNQMAAEQVAFLSDTHTDFSKDVATFIASKLTEREGKIFSLFVFGGKMGQTDIGKILGVCQATVANDLHCSLELFKEWYFTKGEFGYQEGAHE